MPLRILCAFCNRLKLACELLPPCCHDSSLVPALGRCRHTSAARARWHDAAFTDDCDVPTALQRMGSQASVLTSPFSLVIGMSSLIMIASLCGLGGACCAVNNDDGTPGKLRRHANRALFLYYFVIIFTNCGLFYGMMLCFIWSDEANDIVMAISDTLSEA